VPGCVPSSAAGQPGARVVAALAGVIQMAAEVGDLEAARIVQGALTRLLALAQVAGGAEIELDSPIQRVAEFKGSP
jgi:N-acetylglucosamine kinase-like BadF-type ATPase